MKKYLTIILILLFPIMVNAENKISCYNSETFDVSECDKSCNFTCSGIKGDEVTFKHNDEDYSKYFKLDNDKKTVNIVNKNIEFNSSFEKGIVIISDGTNTGLIYIKNKAYIPPTTTTTTTTTADPNIKELVVSLDPNDGSAIEKKTCKLVTGSDSCSITLPTLNKEGFNGWGTAKTCKTGSSGSIRVVQDVTYYACYENNENTNSSDLYLESLEVLDKDTKEKIEFGTFSRKKTEYEFKILYDVKNIEINAKTKEGIEVVITGNENLKVGENEVLVTLKNNDETSIYKLKVTRLKEGETINNIHYLKSLVIGGFEDKFKFDKNTFIYNLQVDKDVKKLEITAKPENEEDKYEIKNNSNLVNGSKIEIVLTSDEGDPTIYTINIIKDESNNLLLYIIIGIVGVLAILILVIMIIKNKKNKKSNNTVSPQTVDNQKKDIEILDI